jgi:hypothetical protein
LEHDLFGKPEAHFSGSCFRPFRDLQYRQRSYPYQPTKSGGQNNKLPYFMCASIEQA